VVVGAKPKRKVIGRIPLTILSMVITPRQRKIIIGKGAK